LPGESRSKLPHSITGKVGTELSCVPFTARLAVSETPITRRFTFRVLGQRSRVLSPEELTLPDRKDVQLTVEKEPNGKGLRVYASFSPEFTRDLFVNGTIPLMFQVPGASSATVLFKSRK